MYTSSTHMHMLYSILNNSIASLVYEHIRKTYRQEQSKYEMKLEALQSQKCVCVFNYFNSLYDGCPIAIVQTPAPGQRDLTPHKH